MFTEAIEKNLKQLNFHKSKSKAFIRWAWFFSFLTFGVIFIFAIYTKLLLDTVARIYIEMAVKTSNLSPQEVQFPDFVGLINENYFGYWAVSGFILTLFASLGMLKYHTNRATALELENINLSKLQSVSEHENTKDMLVTKLIESTLQSVDNKQTTVSLNPILDAITTNTEKVINKLSDYKP